MSENVAKRSGDFCVDKRIVIYWPKSYLLVLIYYYWEGRGRPDENGLKRHESDTAIQRKENDGKKKGNKKMGENKIPAVVKP